MQGKSRAGAKLRPLFCLLADTEFVLFPDSPLLKSRKAVIWRLDMVVTMIGRDAGILKAHCRDSRGQRNPTYRVHGMSSDGGVEHGFEISARFREMIEARVERLDRDAAQDEMRAALLKDGDHIRRQIRLVAVQRAEALRMRLFLDRARTREAQPFVAS
jgi:hypothetical protein